jgi:hypothetical protein
MGCSLIDICSISVPFLPNCIVKPFISFTPSVSGTTLSVPSVYFIFICIYFIDVPQTDGVKLMKGFTIQLGRKGTDMEQMSMREHPISELSG